jgi:MFS family permease
MYLKKNINLLMLFNFLISFRPYSSIAIIYFSQITHSYALGFSLFSITQIAQAVSEIPTGIYSDILGRRFCLIVGALTSVLSVLFYAIGHSYLVLVIGAVLQGIYFAFFNGNNVALLYETLSETNQIEKYNEATGRTNSMMTLAFAVSGVIGSIVIYYWSFIVLMWLSVVPQLICLVASFLFIEPPIHREKGKNIYSHLKEAWTHFVTNTQLRRLSIADILSYGIGEAAFQFQAVFYNTLLPVWTIGFINTLNNLISTFSYHFSGKVISKFKSISILISQEIYGRAINILALLFPSVLSPFLTTSTSIFYGVGNVAKNSLLQEQLTNKQRATMPSINALLASCLYALAAFLIGLLADKIGAAKTLLLAQLALLPVLWLYIKVRHGTNKLI